MNSVSLTFKYFSSFKTTGDNMKKRSRSIYSRFSKYGIRISLKENKNQLNILKGKHFKWFLQNNFVPQKAF